MRKSLTDFIYDDKNVEQEETEVTINIDKVIINNDNTKKKKKSLKDYLNDYEEKFE